MDKVLKRILNAFLLSIIYYVISFIYFFAGFVDVLTENPIREFLDIFLSYPAIVFFAAGYSGGELEGLKQVILFFFLTWLIAFVLLSLIYLIIKSIMPKANQ